ncbi:hypothetical protein [Crocosphaera sp.]|uniref:hypothetical protein n=1 Tax=Crocosphaera sp. TaxID=2729996 RepID=UPI0026364B45|nr:hypothetical protein [Crocosphaera sp.]MDJ0579662.1 hypothetical protein [Crocosphaera sp.]
MSEIVILSTTTGQQTKLDFDPSFQYALLDFIEEELKKILTKEQVESLEEQLNSVSHLSRPEALEQWRKESLDCEKLWEVKISPPGFTEFPSELEMIQAIAETCEDYDNKVVSIYVADLIGILNLPDACEFKNKFKAAFIGLYNSLDEFILEELNRQGYIEAIESLEPINPEKCFNLEHFKDSDFISPYFYKSFVNEEGSVQMALFHRD